MLQYLSQLAPDTREFILELITTFADSEDKNYVPSIVKLCELAHRHYQFVQLFKDYLAMFKTWDIRNFVVCAEVGMIEIATTQKCLKDGTFHQIHTFMEATLKSRSILTLEEFSILEEKVTAEMNEADNELKGLYFTIKQLATKLKTDTAGGAHKVYAT